MAAATPKRGGTSSLLNFFCALSLVAALAIVNALGADAKSTPLIDAVRERDTSAITHLLEVERVDVDAGDEDAWTPLHFAAVMADVKIVKLLLEHGADVNAKAHRTVEPARTPASITPLMMAALTKRDDSLQILRALLGAGAKLNARNDRNDTALHMAVIGENLDAVRFLVAQHATDVDARGRFARTPLHTAVLTGNVALVRALLSHGADANAKARYSFNDAAMRPSATPLHLAVEHESDTAAPIIEALLEAGADPSARDFAGYTPAERAAILNQLDNAKPVRNAAKSADAESAEATTIESPPLPPSSAHIQ
jgi:26S proteasome non-ATPase regulatory subunit 10